MPLILTDEQQMLAESAKGFLAENAPVSALRKLRDEKSDDGAVHDPIRIDYLDAHFRAAHRAIGE